MTPRGMRAWLVAASTAFSLGAAELALRAVHYGDRRPNEIGLAADGLPERAVARGATTDARGFRGPPFAGPRRAGVYRIAVLGDSFTFGVGVANDETLPARLGAELARRGYEAEVLNLGVPGSNAQQYALLAERALPELSPDAVLLVVMDNDADVMPWNPDPVETCGLPPPAWFTESLDRALLRRTYVYRPLHAALGDDGCTGPQRCLLGAEFGAELPQVECFRHSLERVVRTAARVGATVSATHYFSLLAEWTAGPPPQRSDAYLAGRFYAMGVPYDSLMPALRGVPGARLRLPNDSHPSALAHRLAAAYLADRFESRWREPGARAPRRTAQPPAAP